MTRSTRGVVDETAGWSFRNIQFLDPRQPAAEPGSRQSDYVVVDPGFQIYRGADTYYTKLVFWGVGIVSFGEVSEAQTQFVANLTSSSEISGFPGDYIALGFSEMQWPALEYGRKADYVYFTSHSNPMTIGGSGFATVVITPDEIALSGNALNGLEVGLRVGTYDVPGAQSLFLADLNPVLGTSGSDEIIGSDVPEAINGLGGSDHLVGGAGSDRLTGGAGKDHLEGGLGNDRLSGDGGADLLHGGDGNDRLEGGIGNDVLAPGTGNDLVDGGAGKDLLLLDLSKAYGSLTINFASDGVIDTPGIDVVTYSNMETAEIQGSAYIDLLTGGTGDDKLFGNGSYDILRGGGGDDLLDGGGSAASAVGGLPDGGTSLGTALHIDPYFTNTFSDEIPGSDEIPHVSKSWSLSGRGAGTVSRQEYLAVTVDAGSTITIDLDNGGFGSNVNQSFKILDGLSNTYLSRTVGDGGAPGEAERFTYTFSEAGTYYLELSTQFSTSRSQAFQTFVYHISLDSAVPLEGDRLLGDAGNDTLNGGEGSDLLDGGTGKDLMTGSTGNDTYVVDDVRDRVVECIDSLGTDLVLSSISYKLGQHVENLTLTGSLDINGTGNSLANTIVGNSGANTINGGLGRDILSGGGGADKFLFNTALSAANRDDILDFSVIDDTIALDRSIFQKISGNGALAASAFVVGTAAVDGLDRIIYDRTAGDIYYDRDGTGKAAQVLFAHVDAGTQLTHWDFLMV